MGASAERPRVRSLLRPVDLDERTKRPMARAGVERRMVRAAMPQPRSLGMREVSLGLLVALGPLAAGAAILLLARTGQDPAAELPTTAPSATATPAMVQTATPVFTRPVPVSTSTAAPTDPALVTPPSATATPPVPPPPPEPPSPVVTPTPSATPAPATSPTATPPAVNLPALQSFAVVQVPYPFSPVSYYFVMSWVAPPSPATEVCIRMVSPEAPNLVCTRYVEGRGSYDYQGGKGAHLPDGQEICWHVFARLGGGTYVSPPTETVCVIYDADL